MNSEAGASHVRKQSFHEDEYRAFRIALDVKETEIVDFWNNIDELKSKKEFLRIRKDLEKKIVKKKKPLQERSSNYDEKGAEDKNTKTKGRILSSSTRGGENENICGSADMKENVPPASENDSKLKGGSTGATKKKTNERKTKKTDRRHASVTDATNMIHSGSDDVMREGKKSKGARVLAEKKSLKVSQETGKMGEQAFKKKGKNEVKKSEIDSDKEIGIGTDGNKKPKVKWQVQFKEKKSRIKQNENLQIEEIPSNFPGIEEKDFGKEKKNAKKKTVSFLNEEYIEKKGDIKRPRQRNEKTKNVPEVDGKDIEEKKGKLKEKKVRAKKTVLFKDGEEKISEAEIKGKDAGNQETVIKKSKNKRSKAVEDENIEKVDDQKKATSPKKSRNCKTVKSTEPKTKKKVLNKKDKKLVNQDEDKFVNKMHDDKIKNEAKNIKSDHELMTSNAPNTHSGVPKEINYNSEKVNTVLKNNECGFQDKNFEKPSLTEVMENPCLLERKINNSENQKMKKSVEDPKKSSDCALDGENKCEKSEKIKTLYEIKQEVKRKLKEIRYEKKMAKAVEKLSQYALRHVKKLDSNPLLKQHLNLESDSDSDFDSDSDTSWDSSDFYCSECSCSTACSCSCCSSCGSSYDSESSSCSCSNCCSSSSNPSDSDSD